MDKAGGAGDRVGLGYLFLQTSDGSSGGTIHIGVKTARLKVRVGQLVGPRSEVSVYGSIGSSERTIDTVQNDRLHTWELAIPAEFLLSNPRAFTRASVFIGPRVMFEHYEDHVRPDQSFHAVFPGAVGGVHLVVGPLQLFAEGTLVYLPRESYLGRPSGGTLTVMPALSAALCVGPAFRWPRGP